MWNSFAHDVYWWASQNPSYPYQHLWPIWSLLLRKQTHFELRKDIQRKSMQAWRIWKRHAKKKKKEKWDSKAERLSVRQRPFRKFNTQSNKCFSETCCVVQWRCRSGHNQFQSHTISLWSSYARVSTWRSAHLTTVRYVLKECFDWLIEWSHTTVKPQWLF